MKRNLLTLASQYEDMFSENKDAHFTDDEINDLLKAITDHMPTLKKHKDIMFNITKTALNAGFITGFIYAKLNTRKAKGGKKK